MKYNEVESFYFEAEECHFEEGAASERLGRCQGGNIVRSFPDAARRAGLGG